MIELHAAELIRVDLPLVRPFRTSFGEQLVREAVLLRLDARIGGDDATGWGECVAMSEPLYSSEYGAGAWAVIRDFLIPLLTHAPLHGIADVPARLSKIRGNHMAKATVEMALTDAWLRSKNTSLAKHLGGVRDRVACGVSVGIAPGIDALLEEVAGYVAQGYRRVKLKVEPGRDVSILAAVRDAHFDVPITADANAAYTLADLGPLKHFDQFGLDMIEQPLPEDHLHDHAALAAIIRTPVCLDESITSAAVAADAISMGACAIINIKQGRLGGFAEAVAVHDAAMSSGVPVWCGGMLETGIGRAANLALASMENFTLPGDTSASDRYFAHDITEPFVLSPDGTLAVPDGPGIGVTPLPEVLARTTAMREKIDL